MGKEIISDSLVYFLFNDKKCRVNNLKYNSNVNYKFSALF